MGDFDRKIVEIDEKVEKITQMMLGMQDSFLSLKAALETVNREDFERSQCAQVVATTNKSMGTFLKGKETKCKIADFCTNLIERSTTKIIHTYLEKGSQAALELIDYYVNVSLKKFDTSQCPEQCYKNAVNVFNGLRELLTTSRHAQIQLPTNIFLLGKNGNQKQFTEDEICKHLVPLSNITRLRILKILEKGGRNYADLERETGIKAGHLLFHLNKLIAVGYVKQEKPQGRYLITRNGLKALQMSQEFCNLLF